MIIIKHSYEYYKIHKCVRTKKDILHIINLFPGITFEEILETLEYHSIILLSHRIHDLRKHIIVVEDINSKLSNDNNIKSMYFHINKLPEIESLINF